MTEPTELLPGTLDLLILKAISLGPLPGYAVLLRIQQGSLYPLTPAGLRRLKDEVAYWQQFPSAIALVLGAVPEDV